MDGKELVGFITMSPQDDSTIQALKFNWPFCTFQIVYKECIITVPSNKSHTKTHCIVN